MWQKLKFPNVDRVVQKLEATSEDLSKQNEHLQQRRTRLEKELKEIDTEQSGLKSSNFPSAFCFFR